MWYLIFIPAFVILIMVAVTVFLPVRAEDLPATPEEIAEDDNNWRQL